MDDHPDLCVTCGNPVRPFTIPIPLDAIVAMSEAITGRALYCQACFDQMEGPTDG